MSSTSPVRYSMSPFLFSSPNVFNTLGFNTSASTSSTVLSCSDAMLMARFVAVKVFLQRGDYL